MFRFEPQYVLILISKPLRSPLGAPTDPGGATCPRSSSEIELVLYGGRPWFPGIEVADFSGHRPARAWQCVNFSAVTILTASEPLALVLVPGPHALVPAGSPGGLAAVAGDDCWAGRCEGVTLPEIGHRQAGPRPAHVRHREVSPRHPGPLPGVLWADAPAVQGSRGTM